MAREGAAVLCDIDTSVPEGGITAVVGPSGAGKSTLLRTCNRLEVPTRGRVWFRGDDVAALDPLRLRRRVGMVFQTPTLFPGTVRDNLAVAADGDDECYTAALRAAALDGALLDRAGDSLSAGEAQRACLARTLVTRPEVLLLDEPTAALDARPKLAFERLAAELAAGGLPVLWATHDLDQLDRVANRVLALVGGGLAYAGEPAGLREAGLESFLSGGGS